jgi:hypothetical protein
MISRRLSTLVSVVLAVTATAVQAQDACPPVKDIVNKGYHADENCDRKYFNEYKENVRRDQMYQSLRKEGGALRVPNQKTVTCPTEPVNLIQTGSRHGYDTTWIVENTASVAVVLCWVNPTTGKEYSALDGNITPPTADPRAILKPGEWKAVWTHEGHVFYVRELDPETGQAGRIVLQHRTGLVPIGQGVTGLSCPETDVEPIDSETGKLKSEFSRSVRPGDDLRRCNHIDLGFRNAANCPLHAYYIPDHHALSGAQQCPKEEFKFHLGLDPVTPDFHWDWKSNTKFEGSAIGHSFAFRLASNPSILVETVTLEPTKVIDCPARSEESAVQITADSIILPVRFGHHHHHNATVESLLEYYANATSLPEEYVKAERVGARVSRYGAASAVSF